MNQKALEEMERDVYEQVTRTGQALLDALIHETLHRAGVTRVDVLTGRVRCYVVSTTHPECCGTGVVQDAGPLRRGKYTHRRAALQLREGGNRSADATVKGTWHPVVGELNPWSDPDPLGRRYWGSFDVDTVHGLAHVTGRRIDVLAVQSRFPGSGNFARFLLALMTNYDTVAFWEILNPDLPDTLARRGFRAVVEVVDGESGDGMRWDRNHVDVARRERFEQGTGKTDWPFP